MPPYTGSCVFSFSTENTYLICCTCVHLGYTTISIVCTTQHNWPKNWAINIYSKQAQPPPSAVVVAIVAANEMSMYVIVCCIKWVQNDLSKSLNVVRHSLERACNVCFRRQANQTCNTEKLKFQEAWSQQELASDSKI